MATFKLRLTMNKTNKAQGSETNDLIAGFEKTINALEKKISYIEAQYDQIKNLVDNLPGDIYWKDKNGIWGGMNKRCARSLQRMGFIKGGVEAEILGKTDYQIFDQKTADGYRQNDLEVMEKQTEISREEKTKLPSGENVTLFSTKIPLLDKEGHVVGMVGNTVDITYLKKIESELKIAKEKSETANFIMTEFIANMGHDLATPISDVGSVAQMLDVYSDECPEFKDLFQTLFTRAAACEEVRKRIINATSISNLEVKPETFSVAQELLKLEKKFRPDIEAKKLKLIIHPLKPKKEDVIETDREKFHAILDDLLSNAINFTEDGSVTISAIKQNDLIIIQIIDTGIGIPADKLDYIFEQYTKLSRSNKHGENFKGVGAGLYLARMRANILGTTISVESELGKGSTFTLSIPAHPKKNGST